MTVEQCSWQIINDKTIELHRRIAAYIKVGTSLVHLNTFVGQQIQDLKCKSECLGFPLYPQKFPSHACYSINDVICHGNHLYKKYIEEGDVVSIDIALSLDGYIADLATTYIIKTPKKDEDLLLCTTGRMALQTAMRAIPKDNNLLINTYSQAVEMAVERSLGNCFVVKHFGGHTIKRNKMHSPPYVPNYPCEYSVGNFQPGQIYALEPMIGIGTGLTKDDDDYPYMPRTSNGQNSCHFEHNILITEKNELICLSKGMDELPIIIGV